MSSNAYLMLEEMDDPILLKDWKRFYAEHNLAEVGVQISYGEHGLDPPGEEIRHISVATYFMGDTAAVARVAGLIWARWGGWLQCSPEVRAHFLAETTHPTGT